MCSPLSSIAVKSCSVPSRHVWESEPSRRAALMMPADRSTKKMPHRAGWTESSSAPLYCTG